MVSVMTSSFEIAKATGDENSIAPRMDTAMKRVRRSFMIVSYLSDGPLEFGAPSTLPGPPRQQLHRGGDVLAWPALRQNHLGAAVKNDTPKVISAG
ncbi:MAG: hypothetical protein AMXMBFR64_52000 [Myxococcales bacterium]